MCIYMWRLQSEEGKDDYVGIKWYAAFVRVAHCICIEYIKDYLKFCYIINR